MTDQERAAYLRQLAKDFNKAVADARATGISLVVEIDAFGRLSLPEIRRPL